MKEAGHVSPRDKQKKLHVTKTLEHGKRVVLQQLGITSCQICSFSRALDLCHIHPNRDKGEVVKDNILILCPNHHRCFDKGLLERSEFELIKEKVRTAEGKYNFSLKHYKDW